MASGEISMVRAKETKVNALISALYHRRTREQELFLYKLTRQLILFQAKKHFTIALIFMASALL